MKTSRHLGTLVLCAACVLRPGVAATPPSAEAGSSPAQAPGAPPQSQASFEAAVRNRSTAPSYVAITVIDERSGTSQAFCTTANFLLGAMHREHDIAYDAAGIAQLEAMAISAPGHVFRFSRPEALANLPVTYSPFDFAVAQSTLKDMSVAELRARFGDSRAARGMSAPRGGRRDALACALIGRGLSPYQTDITGEVLVAP